MQQNKIDSIWRKQPQGLSDIEKYLRILSFLNYEAGVDTAILGFKVAYKPASSGFQWFLDLSLYILHTISVIYPPLIEKDNLHTLYIQTAKGLLFLCQLYKSKDFSEGHKKLYVKEYIRISDMLIEEIRLTIRG